MVALVTQKRNPAHSRHMLHVEMPAKNAFRRHHTKFSQQLLYSAFGMLINSNVYIYVLRIRLEHTFWTALPLGLIYQNEQTVFPVKLLLHSRFGQYIYIYASKYIEIEEIF